jgi:hypothetical protein
MVRHLNNEGQEYKISHLNLRVIAGRGWKMKRVMENNRVGMFSIHDFNMEH